MTGKTKVYSPLSQIEATQRVAALTVSDRTKLMLISYDLAHNTGWSPEDLLQEALTRVIAGKRALPAEVPVARTIFNIMKSIASSIRKSSEGKIAKASDELESATAPVDTEEEAPRTDHPEAVAADGMMAQALYDKFSGEDEVQLVLMKLADGASREEICTELSIDHTRYASIRRRIRRAYNELSV